jgi:MFS family permease
MQLRPFLTLTDYRRLWVGNTISNLGDGVSFIAVPLLATTLTDNPVLVAGLSVAYTVPRLLVSLLSGALVDRLDRRRLMYFGNFGRAAAMGTLGVAAAFGVADITLLYAVFVVLGLLETVADNAAFAILPTVVEREDLERANGQIAGAQLVADEFIGPPLGGFLFAVAVALPILFDAASFAIAAVIFLSLRGDFASHIAAETKKVSIRQDIGVGVRWLARHRFLRSMTVMFTLTNLAYSIPFSILVLFAREQLDLSEVGYGILLSVSAIGGLLGSWLAARIRRLMGFTWTICGALLVGAASFLVIAATSNPIVAGIALAAYIFQTVVWNIVAASVSQRLIPDELRGRVGSVNRTRPGRPARGIARRRLWPPCALLALRRPTRGHRCHLSPGHISVGASTTPGGRHRSGGVGQATTRRTPRSRRTAKRLPTVTSALPTKHVQQACVVDLSCPRGRRHPEDR